MKMIHKKNVIPIICITYTVVSILLTGFEIVMKGKLNPTQLNLILFLLLSILGVAVLSQHYRLERFSPLTMIVIQYAIAIAAILLTLKIASYFVDIHPDGYKDMTLSFSVPYFIGTIIYYLCLRIEVRKQNQILRSIREHKE